VIDASIVVVSWNGREVLADCLASIERELLGRADAERLSFETIVVDNGSSDGSAELVRSRFAWAQLVALPENRGFAAGNNVGLRLAKGRHAVLLNSDTVVQPGALERCVRFLDANPRVGVVGPQLLNPDGSRQNSIHNYPSLATEWLPKGLLERLFPRRFPSKRFEHAGPIEVEAVLGACLCVRREVLEQVGLVPEDYFLFLEETDWCLRIAAAGWRIVHLPDARIVHVHGASSKKVIPWQTRIEYHRSLYHFFRKHRGSAVAASVVALRFAKSLLYVVVRALLAPFSRRERRRWTQDARVCVWHLAGCPLAGWGIPRSRPLGDPAPRLEARS
jgi:hypothetical protein